MAWRAHAELSGGQEPPRWEGSRLDGRELLVSEGSGHCRGVGTGESASWGLLGEEKGPPPHTQATLLVITGSKEIRGGITGPSYGWAYGDPGGSSLPWQN